MNRRLLLFALLVYCVILFRAAHQAVTLDEADGFNNFSTGNLDMSFYPSSGNHVLQSLLARYATQTFGISQFIFRIPAMLGAAIYLLATVSIVTRLGGKFQLLSYAILVLNPFFLDYLVAARGYALALGLLAAIVALAIADPPTPLRASLVSICAALAIAANFSFAFATISTLAAFLATLLSNKTPWKRWVVLAAATALPGALVGLALIGPTLRDFPRSQLYYGADTWVQMGKEMVDAVFPRQNLSLPFSVEPFLTAVQPIAAWLILIPIAIGFWSARDWPIRFVCLAFGFTLTAHAAAHALQGLLLPLDRTSLFFAFFLSLIAVYGAANAPEPLLRRTSTTILTSALVLFVLAFRTNYFRIWDFDLDIDRGFQALVQYAREHPVASAGCTWRYGGAYNFYNTAQPALPKCDFIEQDAPPPRAAYFLHVPGQADFIAKSKLKIVYQGAVSGLVVGVVTLNKNEPPGS